MIKRVGIIRGGKGEHFQSSLKKGGDIISHIQDNLADKYKTFDILIDRQGLWHLGGIPIKPVDLVHRIDVVWDVSDPSSSVMLDNFAIPNISSGSFSSAMKNNNDMLGQHTQKLGVHMPKKIVLPLYQKDFDGPQERYSIKKAKEVHGKFAGPWIVKSFTPDLNMGIHLAKTFPELVDAIEDGVKHEKSILIEEFVAGKVASVHSVANFRGEDIYAFPVGKIFGSLSGEEKEKLISLAKDLHGHLGATHYLKSDFILGSRGKVYLLDIESTPNLKPYSNFSEACESVGTKAHHLVQHILEQAYRQ